ncbi:MAG: hypothetical protein ABT01_08670 [Clostridium sp. SCN 57-10]|nr:MAG: hypothetical protein ABT01_08670 [Clostridium sp. SCN 57-10]
MKKKIPVRVLIPAMLLATAAMYGLHYLIFRDAHHIGIFFVSDIAFLPLEVVLVSLVLERMVERTHENDNQGKICILQSIFFRDCGADMIRYFLTCDNYRKRLIPAMSVREEWQAPEYESARKFLRSYSFALDAEKLDFFAVHYHLNKHHAFFLQLLESPSLTDRDEFTDLLLTLYHFWEELSEQYDLRTLPPEKIALFSEYAQDSYRLLSSEWLDNMQKIKKSSARRTLSPLRETPFC